VSHGKSEPEVLVDGTYTDRAGFVQRRCALGILCLHRDGHRPALGTGEHCSTECANLAHQTRQATSAAWVAANPLPPVPVYVKPTLEKRK
jgi:hypothetical protein